MYLEEDVVNIFIFYSTLWMLPFFIHMKLKFWKHIHFQWLDLNGPFCTGIIICSFLWGFGCCCDYVMSSHFWLTATLWTNDLQIVLSLTILLSSCKLNAMACVESVHFIFSLHLLLHSLQQFPSIIVATGESLLPEINPKCNRLSLVLLFLGEIQAWFHLEFT